MDPEALAVRLYLCRVEERLLTYAGEARSLRADLDVLGFVDVGMARSRGELLLGLAEFRHDDIRILMPRTRTGRVLVWAARLLIGFARAVG